MKGCLLLLALISWPAVSQQNSESELQSASEPKMRAVDRDWSYFEAVNCDDINKVVFHSRSEELLLARRKKQCLDKYKAFLPRPVDR